MESFLPRGAQTRGRPNAAFAGPNGLPPKLPSLPRGQLQDRGRRQSSEHNRIEPFARPRADYLLAQIINLVENSLHGRCQGRFLYRQEADNEIAGNRRQRIHRR